MLTTGRLGKLITRKEDAFNACNDMLPTINAADLRYLFDQYLGNFEFETEFKRYIATCQRLDEEGSETHVSDSDKEMLGMPSAEDAGIQVGPWNAEIRTDNRHDTCTDCGLIEGCHTSDCSNDPDPFVTCDENENAGTMHVREVNENAKRDDPIVIQDDGSGNQITASGRVLR